MPLARAPMRALLGQVYHESPCRMARRGIHNIKEMKMASNQNDINKDRDLNQGSRQGGQQGGKQSEKQDQQNQQSGSRPGQSQQGGQKGTTQGGRVDDQEMNRETGSGGSKNR